VKYFNLYCPFKNAQILLDNNLVFNIKLCIEMQMAIEIQTMDMDIKKRKRKLALC